MAKPKSVASGIINARYDTLEEAVVQASSIFNPISIEDDKEIGGHVIRDNDGKFYFSYSVGEKGRGNVKMITRKPESHEVVGLWHTHGGPADNDAPRDVFSEGDVGAVNDLSVPSFIVDNEGAMRKLNPGAENPLEAVRVHRAGGKVLSGDELLGEDGEPVRVRAAPGLPLGPRPNHIDEVRFVPPSENTKL